MGEEEKKPEEKKAEESAAPENAEKDKQKGDDEKKADEKEVKEPPPPQEIVLKVFMHCEGCARKVKKCLKGFQGVEDVQTDCNTHKVVVKGEKADPLKVLERVQKKSHSPVELLSPIPPPKPPAEEEAKKPEENNEAPKPEEKKEEPPQVITVILGVHMHCEACAQEMRKRILRMKGVESAEPDLKSSQVAVRGTMEPPKLVEFIHKRTGKAALILKIEPEKKADEPAQEAKEEKKAEEGEKEEAKKGEEEGKDKKEAAAAVEAEPPKEGAEQPPQQQQQQPQEDPKVGVKKNEVYYYHPHQQMLYPQRYVQDMYAYPPQIFSDENPNACSVM